MVKTICKNLFLKVRNEEPLVHHITNPVTINDCANVTLAIGGSPVMATSVEEVAEMVSLANALVINFGTIDEAMYEAMIVAGQAANRQGIPVILDPVGVGATTFRNEKVADLLKKVRISIVRGNLTEVYALIGGEAKTRGVDAGEVEEMSREEIAIEASKRLQAVVVISGEEDVIADGEKQVIIENGTPLLTRITGTGCMTASLIACFVGVRASHFHAAIAGISTMALAGENAKKRLAEKDGIGTYHMQLMDEISRMTGPCWEKGVRLRCNQLTTYI